MNNNTTKVIDWDRTRELNDRRAREAMEDGSYIAGWVTVYKHEPLEFAGVTPCGTPVQGQFTNEPAAPAPQSLLDGERLTADIKSYGTQLPMPSWLEQFIDSQSAESAKIGAELVVDSLDGETEPKPARSNAERAFLDYSYAGSKVAKVIRSAVILRAEPGESWESENFGAIVEMTDGRILPLITDKYDGFDDWDRSAAEAQLAMVEKNAAELRAMLASWPSKPVTIHEGKTSVQTFADQSYRVRSSTPFTAESVTAVLDDVRRLVAKAMEAGDE